MRIRNLFWLVPGAAGALLFATCAPYDATPPEQSAPAPQTTMVAPPPTPVGTEPIGPPEEVKTASPLQVRVERAINIARNRDVLVSNGFWTVFHAILGLGPNLQLLDPANGTRVNALEYICNGGEIRGMRFIPTGDGLDVQMGPTFVGQGHQDQFLAEMIEWGVTPDRKIKVLGKDYTFLDFIHESQARARVNQDQELTWAIIAIGETFGPDATWTNKFGEKLTYEDVVRYELNQPIETAACGGTHRLYGLTYALQLHQRRGGRVEGIWKEVADKLDKYKKLAHEYQNEDGSLSTSHFRGPGHVPDKQTQISTTGHMVEWLAFAMSDDEIQEPWMQDAVNALSMMFLETENQPVEGGTIYHATHGLLLYYARAWDGRKLGPNEPVLHLPPGMHVGKERAPELPKATEAAHNDSGAS